MPIVFRICKGSLFYARIQASSFLLHPVVVVVVVFWLESNEARKGFAKVALFPFGKGIERAALSAEQRKREMGEEETSKTAYKYEHVLKEVEEDDHQELRKRRKGDTEDDDDDDGNDSHKAH